MIMLSRQENRWRTECKRIEFKFEPADLKFAKCPQLHFCKNSQGYGADTYLSYVLKNAIISGYRIKVHKDDMTRPNEEIKISFTAIETRYTPHDDKGTAKASVMMGYDLTTATTI